MKTAFFILLIFSLAACQKEIQLYQDPKTGQIPTPPSQPEPEPEPVNYREDPTEDVIMYQFASMLRERKQYKITEYYSVKRDLWNELPSWVKDDIYTFQELGKGWVTAGSDQHPGKSFEILQKPWQLYGEAGVARLDWLDENYDRKAYWIAAYESEQSFTISALANDSSKVFYTLTYIGKE